MREDLAMVIINCAETKADLLRQIGQAMKGEIYVGKPVKFILSYEANYEAHDFFEEWVYQAGKEP